MTWQLWNVFELWFAPKAERHSPRGLPPEALARARDEARALAHLEQLRVPHPLSTPAKRMLNHLC